jgi:hypothetical protein
MASDDMSPRRMTIGTLERQFNAQASSDATAVTFTSVPTRVAEVSPGSLFIPAGKEVTLQAAQRAVLAGAYAVGLSTDAKSGIPASDEDGAHTVEINDHVLGIPVVFIPSLEQKVGSIASEVEGDPSQQTAIFVAYGPQSHAIAHRLAQLLHMLGNPVGVLVDRGSQSVTRPLDLTYPLDGAHVQHALAIMAEDGASAVTIAADDATLDPYALDACAIDVVYGESGAMGLHGAHFSSQTHHVPAISQSGDAHEPNHHALSVGWDKIDTAGKIAIAMATAAGITSDAIQQAAQVFHEFDGDKGTN